MLRSLSVLFTVIGISATATADIVTTTLDFLPASSSQNRLNFTVSASYSGVSDSDSDSTDVLAGSDMSLNIDYDFDPMTRQVSAVNSIEFVGGDFMLSNVSLKLTFLLFFNEYINSSGVGGTFDTPNPPGSISSVTGASTNSATAYFPTQQHDMILDRGTLALSGIRAETINLASTPIGTTTAGIGNFVTTLTSIGAGGIANYDIAMTLPINFDELVLDDGSMSASVAGTGTFKAAGSFSVAPVNHAPVAVNDPMTEHAGLYSGNEDSVISVAAYAGVLANDTDVDGNTLTAIEPSNPAHGSVTLGANGHFNYTPDPNYHGPDSFTYKAFDGTVKSNVATVSLNIISVNDAPVAVDDAYSCDQGTTLRVYAGEGVLANDDDADNHDTDPNNNVVLQAFLDSDVTHGMLTLGNNGWLQYTPDAHFSGIDSFTYMAYDGIEYSELATVLIDVLSTIQVPGDANGDGHVNDADAAILADHWGDGSATWAMGDFDEDGVVGARDASIMAANWGYGESEASTTAVPEPTMLALLFGATLGLTFSRRRK